MENLSKKILDQPRELRDAICLKHYSHRTEETYVQWIRCYILFHDKQHSAEMDTPEIEAFLTHLAVEGPVAASTQKQALNAILFLYRDVLQQDLEAARQCHSGQSSSTPTHCPESHRSSRDSPESFRCLQASRSVALW